MRIFILEDDPTRIKWFKSMLIGHDVMIVSTVEEAKKMLVTNDYLLLLLDHDLGGTEYAPSDENSGYAVAEFIRDHKITGDIIVHSCNPVGTERMLDSIGRGKSVPFPILKETMIVERT